MAARGRLCGGVRHGEGGDEQEKVEKKKPKGKNPVPKAAHPSVICDVCATVPIVGVRHKCASCPDWDCCSTCLASGRMEASLTAFGCRHEVMLSVRNPAKALLAEPPISATDDGATITVTAGYAAVAAAAPAEQPQRRPKKPRAKTAHRT